MSTKGLAHLIYISTNQPLLIESGENIFISVQTANDKLIISLKDQRIQWSYFNEKCEDSYINGIEIIITMNS